MLQRALSRIRAIMGETPRKGANNRRDRKGSRWRVERLAESTAQSLADVVLTTGGARRRTGQRRLVRQRNVLPAQGLLFLDGQPRIIDAHGTAGIEGADDIAAAGQQNEREQSDTTH